MTNEEFIDVDFEELDRVKKVIPITYILVGINIVVFLLIHLTNVLIENYWFLDKFAKVSYSIGVENEFYRLLTPIFMHYDFQHLLFNCFAIIIFGKPLEIIFGKYKLLVIFIVAGLFGSLSSFIFSDAISIGASGGVFGFFGIHFYLYQNNKEKYLHVFKKDMFQLLIISIVIGFLVPNIDYWAHFGGVLGGYLASHTLNINYNSKKIVLWGMTTIILYIGAFSFFYNNYNNYFDLLNDSVKQINYAVAINDHDALINIKQDIIDQKPFLPPITNEQGLIEFIDKQLSK